MPDPALDHVGRHDITHEIAELTDRVTAFRVVRRMARRDGVSILGKMKELTESAEDFTKETHATLDGIAKKIAKATLKRDDAAGKHHAYYDGIIAGVDESVEVIDRLSNGHLGEDGEG